MRTDYFDDILPDPVTSVTRRKPGLVTLESNNKASKNRGIDEALPLLPMLPAKTSNTEQRTEQSAKRHAYRFVLHNGHGGGVVLTDESTLDKARDSLLEQYGDRLALVVRG